MLNVWRKGNIQSPKPLIFCQPQNKFGWQKKYCINEMSCIFIKISKYCKTTKINKISNLKDSLRDWETNRMSDLRPWHMFRYKLLVPSAGRNWLKTGAAWDGGKVLISSEINFPHLKSGIAHTDRSLLIRFINRHQNTAFYLPEKCIAFWEVSLLRWEG